MNKFGLWKRVDSAVHQRITNMMKQAAEQSESWFRNPWVWLVIAIPSMTVIGCMVTIYVALSNPDYLVHDATNSVQIEERERR